MRSIFQRTYGEVVTLCPPGEEDRRNFFSDLLLVQAARPPPRLRNTGTCHVYLHVSAVRPRGQCCLHVPLSFPPLFSMTFSHLRMKTSRCKIFRLVHTRVQDWLSVKPLFSSVSLFLAHIKIRTCHCQITSPSHPSSYTVSCVLSSPALYSSSI